MLTPDTPVALTFDDVLLQPAYSSVLPRDVSLKTRLARDLTLNIPLLSSAMDTVTEANTAISMAVEGGLGIIHKNLNPLEQAREVSKVKRAMTGVVSRVCVDWIQPLVPNCCFFSINKTRGFRSQGQLGKNRP